MMALGTWFSEDIARAIASARTSVRVATKARTCQPSLEEAAWLAGYEAALDTMAVAFGLAAEPAGGGQAGEVITLPKAYYRVVEGG